MSITALIFGWYAMSSAEKVSIDVCKEETLSCYPLSCHSISPRRLLWRLMLINLAEITSSRLSALLIVRMTSSPSPLSHLYPHRRTQSMEGEIFNPGRSCFKKRECSLSPVLPFLPHTTTHTCTLTSISTVERFCSGTVSTLVCQR